MAPPEKKARTEANPLVCTMGEAMLRFAPLEADEGTTRHRPQRFLRSLGGDELNVAVAVAQLGLGARWISVLPTGPLGDVVAKACAEHGVEFRGLRTEGDLGIFTVLPESRSVHYQRLHSAFALHSPGSLAWDQLLSTDRRTWLHVTGITPLISGNARQSWDAAIAEAKRRKIPMSMDLNHRKQLGSLEELWAMVAPHAEALEVLILSEEQLAGLAKLHGLPADARGDDEDEQLLRTMDALQAKIKCRRVALCRKKRDNTGLQCRWSLMVEKSDGNGQSSKVKSYAPVHHRPRDDLGGGSAWAAGMIHALLAEPRLPTAAALRRADLLAALSQESEGDFSRVSGAALSAAEQRFEGKEARLPGAEAPDAPAALLTANEAGLRIESTLEHLRRAGAIAILRAKGSPEVAVRRAKELAGFGCRAIELTMDSTDWPLVLGELRRALPPEVVLGIGTVMDDTVCQLGRAASLGAAFALSPIDPVGFIEECHRRGILAVPAGFSSNECWRMHCRGARLIKLFHAATVGPAGLKAILDVTPLRQMNILPSGGCSPANASAWWDAGAFCVGMGGGLVGKDISLEPGTPAFEKAAKVWEEQERDAAKAFFEQAARRSASA